MSRKQFSLPFKDQFPNQIRKKSEKIYTSINSTNFVQLFSLETGFSYSFMDIRKLCFLFSQTFYILEKVYHGCRLNHMVGKCSINRKAAGHSLYVKKFAENDQMTLLTHSSLRILSHVLSKGDGFSIP